MKINVMLSYKCYFILQELYLVKLYPHYYILRPKVLGPRYTQHWTPTLPSTQSTSTTSPQEPTIYAKICKIWTHVGDVPQNDFFTLFEIHPISKPDQTCLHCSNN